MGKRTTDKCEPSEHGESDTAKNRETWKREAVEDSQVERSYSEEDLMNLADDTQAERELEQCPTATP